MNRRRVPRINLLVDAWLREPFAASERPEQLTYGAQAPWSRRITDEHRLAHLVEGTTW